MGSGATWHAEGLDRVPVHRRRRNICHTTMMSKSTILYNGACPVCRHEIEHYRRLDQQGDHCLDFADISGPSPVLRSCGLEQDQAKRRLHVRQADGRLLVGLPAFAAIWDRLPRYRWLAVLVRLPVLRHVLPWIYEPIAFALYQADRRRQHRLTAPRGH